MRHALLTLTRRKVMPAVIALLVACGSTDEAPTAPSLARTKGGDGHLPSANDPTATAYFLCDPWTTEKPCKGAGFFMMFDGGTEGLTDVWVPFHYQNQKATLLCEFFGRQEAIGNGVIRLAPGGCGFDDAPFQEKFYGPKPPTDVWLEYLPETVIFQEGVPFRPVFGVFYRKKATP